MSLHLFGFICIGIACKNVSARWKTLKTLDIRECISKKLFAVLSSNSVTKLLYSQWRIFKLVSVFKV